jgi:hypothetical protein
MKYRFIDLTKFVFQDDQKPDYEFQVPFAYLEQFLSDFVKVAFFDALGAVNEFACHFDAKKYRFIVFTKVVF